MFIYVYIYIYIQYTEAMSFHVGVVQLGSSSYLHVIAVLAIAVARAGEFVRRGRATRQLVASRHDPRTRHRRARHAAGGACFIERR